MVSAGRKNALLTKVWPHFCVGCGADVRISAARPHGDSQRASGSIRPAQPLRLRDGAGALRAGGSVWFSRRQVCWRAHRALDSRLPSRTGRPGPNAPPQARCACRASIHRGRPDGDSRFGGFQCMKGSPPVGGDPFMARARRSRLSAAADGPDRACGVRARRAAADGRNRPDSGRIAGRAASSGSRRRRARARP